MNKPTIKPVYFIILGIIVGLGGFFLLLANPFGWKTPVPYLTTSTPTPVTTGNPSKVTPKGVIAAPTPVLILPTGKQTYNVQGGETDISRITQVTVDPLDVKKGGQQSLSVKMSSKEPISKFTVTLNSDNGTHDYPLTLASGDTTTGVWTAQYTVSDSTATIYDFVFNIITNNGNKTVTTFPVR
ncbi:MAG TPA: hypothetical protein VF837_04195 [Patescibacteria group bacterium]